MNFNGWVTRKCVDCGEPFKTENRQQSHCPNHLADFQKVICAWCKGTFDMRHHKGNGKVYCSMTCRDLDEREEALRRNKNGFPAKSVMNCQHCNRMLQAGRCPRHGEDV